MNRDRVLDRFRGRVFKASYGVAEIADLSLEDTISLANTLADVVIGAMRRDQLMEANSPREPMVGLRTHVERCQPPISQSGLAAESEAAACLHAEQKAGL